MNTENDQAFDDDYMLQLALQMSIQQVRGGSPGRIPLTFTYVAVLRGFISS